MAGRRAEVLSSYRNLLRACRETFSGDYPALAAAFSQARDAFERARHESSDESIQNKVSEAFEAISFLRSNVVQASRKEDGNFAAQIHERHAKGTELREPHEADTSREQ